MAPDLAALFPEIRTYAGQGIDDPAATVRLDLTPQGFHAQVLSPAGVYYVDPYYHLEDRIHVSYFRNDLDAAVRLAEREQFFAVEELHQHSKPAEAPFGPLPLEATLPPVISLASVTLLESRQGKNTSLVPINHPSASAAGEDTEPATQARSGAQLRTYRAAVAATAEYTAFHGGTVPLGQAAVVTAINRVTGIYESELSIRLTLVANNNLLIYTNENTDPYSNDDPEALLDENQANIDARIGNGNYDIGHVFGTGGGGLAAPGVGVAGWKAQGETGSPEPTGDPFYIDYVAHEMGHQFDANHSWSGTIGSCSADNYAYQTGVEPGSGTTLMSYAGICGADNLAESADPYFHAINFDEIINYVDNVIPSVGGRVATGNSVPSVDAGSDYVIPSGTPFVLTASGSDANAADVLTYSWEQMDAGAQRLLTSPDNGTSALFRARPPTANPVRYFPPLANVLMGTSAPGETLPAGGRTLDFRVTVRDNRSGGGGVNTDDVRVKVVNTGEPFRVTAPNTAVHWAARSTQLVTWNVTGTAGNGINAAAVNILLSTDGGLTFPTTLVSATANDGAQLVDIPALGTSSTARIRIEPVGNIFYDVSDVNFFVDPAAAEQTDFGDAPDSFGTLPGSNGPSHTIGGPRLGDFVDGEANALPNGGANSDGSDDDGVAMSPLIAGQSAAIHVHSSVAGAKLDYFFDFDGNGVFGNQANEVFAATLVGGPQLLIVPVPANAVAGSSFARFRISTAGTLGPNGAAADGEVEDYAITIFAAPPTVDMGDAPSSYGTSLATVGASHVVSGPRLGSAVDAEADGAATAMNSGDGSDEDGVKFTQLLVPGASANFSVTASAPATLNYFFDFDGSGIFGDNPNESFQAGVIAGANPLTVPVPPSAVVGNFAARFRLSTAGNLSAYGLALDGEVEDYQVRTIATAVTAPLQFFDSVTAPALPAGWTSSSTTSGGPRNWTTVNTGSDSAPNQAFVAGAGYVSTNRLTSAPFVLTTANQQIRFTHSYTHEFLYDGGVLEISTNGTTFTDFVTAGGTFLTGGYATMLTSGTGNTLANRNAWSGSSSGYFETILQLPSSLLGQTIYLRWIEGTDNSSGDVGWRVDSLQAVRTALAFDYGDAPTPYPTLGAASGAAHAEETALRLGNNFDVEAAGAPHGTAAGDDAAGADDEDGATFTGLLQAGGIGNVTVVASAAGLLQGWIDFNDNGDWNEIGEQIFVDQAVVAGSNSLTFSIPVAAVVSSSTFARFRLSSQGGLAATGQAPDGEVEDYQVLFTAPANFLVTGVITTTTGVIIDFSRDFDRSVLNLYDASNALGPADLVLTGDAAGPIRGSVVLDASNRRITFVATTGRLPPDNYTLTLRSAANGFRDTTLTLLDGDANGTPGGDYVTTFTVNVPPANAVTLSLPNFSRGPQQPVNLPATGNSGLPISFSNGGGITSAVFQLRYNPALLTISSAIVAPGLPAGADVTLNTSTPGVALLTFTSPTPLAAGTTRFVDLQASVPATATYQAKQVLDLTNIVLNGGEVPAIDDDAVHVAAYFGDVSANGGYSGQDASLIARLGVVLDTGFAAFPLLDPVIIGDITGLAGISAQDTSLALQLAVVIPVPEVPPIPSGGSLVFGGPDPKLSIPADLTARPGEALRIPVLLESIVDLTLSPLQSAELVIYYDASVLDVHGVSLGRLLASRSDWLVASRIDAANGRVFISVAGRSTLGGKFAGELVELQATVKATAQPGATALNIAASARGAAFHTQVNEGYLTLIPAPTDRPDDVGVDGRLTIIAPEPDAAAAILSGDLLRITGTSAVDRVYVSETPDNQIRVRVARRLLGDFPRPRAIVIDGKESLDAIVAATRIPTLIVDDAEGSDEIFGEEKRRVPAAMARSDEALLAFLAEP